MKKVGVVITTNGFYGVFVRQCIECYIRHLKDAYIVLYINESNDEITLNLKDQFPMIDIVYISDQNENGGLTGTWNSGIDLCIKNKCEVVILSNDDILFNESIANIVLCASETPKNTLKYFGPLSNNPGPAECNKSQYDINVRDEEPFELLYNKKYSNVNGFYMVFPIHSLVANKFDDKYYFDPSYPFGGNETEWFNRFLNIGGKPIVVPKTFVYHYKIKRWREDKKHILQNPCIYTINLGGYESDNIRLLNFENYDSYFFTDDFNVVYNCIKKNIYPFFVDTKNKEPKLIQRTIKTSPHLYLPYSNDVSIYIDGNLTILPVQIKYFDKILNDDMNLLDIVCFKHWKRETVAEEYIEVAMQKLETLENIKALFHILKNDGFNDKCGLTETNVLVRKHKNIKAFSSEWTKLITVCRRDQLSFDYLMNKHKVKSKQYPYIIKRAITVYFPHSNTENRRVI